MSGASSGDGKGRVCVNLTPRGRKARDEVMWLTGDSMTSCVNRAILAYADIVKVLMGGGTVSVQESPDASTQELKIIF